MIFDPERVSARTRLGRLFRLPLRIIPPRSALPIVGGPLRGKRWIVGSGTHGCWLGTYEASKQDCFATLIEPGMAVFDVGANVGLYTLIAADRVGPSGRVVAFEPLPDNVEFLRRHLRLNHLQDRVDVREVAVAGEAGRGRFATADGKRFEGRLTDAGSLPVTITTLDAVLREDEPVLPDVVKMDVEGAQLQALAGAAVLLEQVRPTLLLATHGPDVHQACCDLLRSHGYVLESLTAAPVEHTDELLALHPERCQSRGAPAARVAAPAIGWLHEARVPHEG